MDKIKVALKAIEELSNQVKDLAPVNLYEHIKDNYDSNVSLFSRETGRHPNSVSHQMSRGAIYYKGEIYVKSPVRSRDDASNT